MSSKSLSNYNDETCGEKRKDHKSSKHHKHHKHHRRDGEHGDRHNRKRSASRERTDRSSKHHRREKEDKLVEESTNNPDAPISNDLQDPNTSASCSLEECHPVAVAASSTTGVNKHAFFKNLLAVEANKPAIGTLHANAARMEKIMEKEAVKNGVGEWECAKCGVKNVKYNVQCEKCRAMKRMNEYR